MYMNMKYDTVIFDILLFKDQYFQKLLAVRVVTSCQFWQINDK